MEIFIDGELTGFGLWLSMALGFGVFVQIVIGWLYGAGELNHGDPIGYWLTGAVIACILATLVFFWKVGLLVLFLVILPMIASAIAHKKYYG